MPSRQLDFALLPFDRPPARVSFDIEIADEIDLRPGEDLDQHGPFAISCAAAITDRGELKHWYAKDAAGAVQRALDAAGARAVLTHLREAQRGGASPQHQPRSNTHLCRH